MGTARNCMTTDKSRACNMRAQLRSKIRSEIRSREKIIHKKSARKSAPKSTGNPLAQKYAQKCCPNAKAAEPKMQNKIHEIIFEDPFWTPHLSVRFGVVKKQFFDCTGLYFEQALRIGCRSHPELKGCFSKGLLKDPSTMQRIFYMH